jgi:hypothetical protein
MGSVAVPIEASIGGVAVGLLVLVGVIAPSVPIEAAIGGVAVGLLVLVGVVVARRASRRNAEALRVETARLEAAKANYEAASHQAGTVALRVADLADRILEESVPPRIVDHPEAFRIDYEGLIEAARAARTSAVASLPMDVPDELIVRFEDSVQGLVRRTRLGELEPLSVRESQEAEVLGPRNIVGFGLGAKVVDGVPQGRPAVQIYVVRKAQPELIEPGWFGADVAMEIVRELGVESDVMEVGRPRTLNHLYKAQTRRIPGGVGLSGAVPNYGTLGGWLTDGTNDFALTCWHCIDCGAGQPNVTGVAHPPQRQRFGTLVASVDPRVPRGKVTVDAAVVRTDPTATAGDFILDIGQITGTRRVRQTNETVRKMGVVTHQTSGQVWAVSSTITLSVGAGVSLVYRGQIKITPGSGPFADEGDSGAIVVDGGNRAVGLFVGGDPGGPAYYATPIDVVLDALRHESNLKRLEFVTYP